MHAPNASNSQNASDATNVKAHSPLDNLFWPWGFWALEANDLNGSCRQTRTCNNFCSQSTSVSIFSCLAACPQDCPRIAHFLAASPATHCHLRASCRTTSPQFLTGLFVWSISNLWLFLSPIVFLSFSQTSESSGKLSVYAYDHKAPEPEDRRTSHLSKN